MSTNGSADGHGDGLADLLRLDEGLISGRVFADQDIFDQELEQIFTRTWLFIGHESELPNPGDFVTRYMGRDPVLVTRDAEGKLHVLLNVCRHRGKRVCPLDKGNAATFRCSYHGWTYRASGELAAVPFTDTYQGKLDRQRFSLVETPGVGVYKGLIFATWEPSPQPLEEYLGPMAWVLDMLFDRSEGVEVVGPPLRWVSDINWKMAASNFAGDGYHLPTTHGYGVALGLDPTGGRRSGYALVTENGHTAALSSSPAVVDAAPYLALPTELWPEMERKLSPDQLRVLKPLMTVVGNVFPNTSFLNVATISFLAGAAIGNPCSFLTVRMWQPLGPDKTEIWSWFFLDKNAPEQWKQDSRYSYLRSFGAAGNHEQDDMVNWAEITQALKGTIARTLPLNYQLELEQVLSEEWPGPGTAYRQATFGEGNERRFYRRWLDLMSRHQPVPMPVHF